MRSRCKRRACKRQTNKQTVRKRRACKRQLRKKPVYKQPKCKRQVHERQVRKQPVCKRKQRKQVGCKHELCKRPECRRHKQQSAYKQQLHTKKSCESNFNIELVWKLLQTYKPTTRDIFRCMKPIELKELCIRIPCYVDLTRWNSLYDIEEKLWDKGRLQKRCKYCKPGLILRTYRRHKQHCTYSNEEIQESRFTEWMLRKKENILNLRLWAYDRNAVKRCNF